VGRRLSEPHLVALGARFASSWWSPGGIRRNERVSNIADIKSWRLAEAAMTFAFVPDASRSDQASLQIPKPFAKNLRIGDSLHIDGLWLIT